MNPLSPIYSFIERSKPPPSQEKKIPSTSEKVGMVAKRAFGYLLHIIAWGLSLQWLKPSPSETVFGDKILVRTGNDGKLEESAFYQSLPKQPYLLSEKGKKLVRRNQVSHLENMHIAPLRVDKGKCMGAACSFLSDFLTHGKIRETAAKFEKGVPIEGVLNQEIYNAYCTANGDEIESGFKQEIDRLFYKYFQGEDKEASPHAVTAKQILILEAIAAYLDPKISQHHRIYKERGKLSTFVKEWIDIGYRGYVKIEEKDLAILKSFDTCLKCMADEEPGHEVSKVVIDDLKGTEFALKLQGLKIASTVLKNASPSQVVEQSKNLDAGAYLLSYPVYDSKGKSSDSHVVALIVDPFGITYLYDPNTAVGWRVNSERPEMLSRLLREYSGYSRESQTERVANRFFGYASPPKDPDQNKGCFLYKVTNKD